MDYYVLTPLFFVLRIAEAFSQFSLVLAISNVKISLKRFFLGSIIFTILFEVVKNFIPQYITAVISFLLAVFVSIFIFKLNYKKSILSYLITVITTAIVDCAVSLSLLKLFNLSTLTEIATSQTLTSIGRTAITVILFIIAFIIKIINQKRDTHTVSNIKSSTNLVTLIVTFFLLIPNLIMIAYYYDNKPLPLLIIIINIVAIIATLLINIFNTQNGIKLIQAEEELITEKTYNSTLEHLVDNLRTFKHDYDNTLHTINGYLFTEDMTGLREFVKQVMKETKTIAALNKLNPELFRNPSIFGLATAKFEYAKQREVTMNFEIYADLGNLAMKTYDFTRTLGIFLDNAIEAAAGSENKIVNFYVVEKNNKVTIDISNSFSDTGLKIEDMNKKGVSSKGQNRGLGLYKVQDILSRYPKIKHDTTIANGMFLQRLIIDKIALPVS